MWKNNKNTHGNKSASDRPHKSSSSHNNIGKPKPPQVQSASVNTSKPHLTGFPNSAKSPIPRSSSSSSGPSFVPSTKSSSSSGAGGGVRRPIATPPLKRDSTAASSGNKNSGGSKLSELQQRFAKKLEGSRFRVINEKLYTTEGITSFQEFQAQPTLFDAYHEGFREQASKWPVNPLDSIIAWIRDKHPRGVVADMGCGDAKLAQMLAPVGTTVHSFDLVSVNPRVVACDIAHTPLQANTCDVVVFCLSLMGTNIADFLREAHRVLKPGGALRIVEVRSRFEGEADGVRKFIKVLKRAGFDVTNDYGERIGVGGGEAEEEGDDEEDGRSRSKSTSGQQQHQAKQQQKKKKIAKDRNGYEVERRDGNNKMFFEVEARKARGRECEPGLEYSAKACIYKRR